MKDLFSHDSKLYQTFRPSYPDELFQFIYQHTKHFEKVWDCATGNGQAANNLAKRFKEVEATDISQQQLDHAVQKANIHYSVCAAEHTHFSNDQFDLITVAQAAHWLNHDLFYQEVRRVAKIDALLAIWGYGLLHVNEQIDPLLEKFYFQTVGPYWDAERKHIDEHYSTLPFPFQEISTPVFQSTLTWSISHFEGYLSTWSSVQKFTKAHGYNPVKQFISSIEPIWKEQEIDVTFDLFLRLGRVHKI